jgi:putative restriction endonuclease
MRYWWVNQNQTFKQELGGGYLWSPKRNANGARNPFYESMREVARVDNPAHLPASHCKPWRDSTNEERLDGENGLLLTPSIDHLFDRGFISFQDNGQLIVSPVAHAASLERMGVPTQEIVNVGEFTSGQRRFLEYHRDAVLLRAVR